MPTECIQERFDFHPLIRRDVVACFDGGAITSDAGALLLREVEQKTGIVRQLAACFTDHRRADRVEHSVTESTTSSAWRRTRGWSGSWRTGRRRRGLAHAGWRPRRSTWAREATLGSW